MKSQHNIYFWFFGTFLSIYDTLPFTLAYTHLFILGDGGMSIKGFYSRYFLRLLPFFQQQQQQKKSPTFTLKELEYRNCMGFSKHFALVLTGLFVQHGSLELISLVWSAFNNCEAALLGLPFSCEPYE